MPLTVPLKAPLRVPLTVPLKAPLTAPRNVPLTVPLKARPVFFYNMSRTKRKENKGRTLRGTAGGPVIGTAHRHCKGTAQLFPVPDKACAERDASRNPWGCRKGLETVFEFPEPTAGPSA